MSAYWDSSAVVAAWIDPVLRLRLHRERGITRTHTLAEVFSAFTGGNLTIRQDPDQAAQTMENLALDLDFVDLDKQQVLEALKSACAKGVRGGRVHDYLHAVAAEKHQATAILTVDRNDFAGLTGLKIEQLD
jgi:predicted nucleic acid-binding protein